jgi:hypothetical protein
MRDIGLAAMETPFRGVSGDGEIVPGLFPIKRTGVSTQPIVDAANVFLASLGEKAATARFPLESDVLRSWSNVHMFLMRHGALMEEMTDPQRDAALGLLRSTLSTEGFETARKIMHLNETIREITQRDIEFGEWLYWVSILGEPSTERPWAWQIDGHHLIVNVFVLGNQVVVTPMFMGSEPTWTTEGKYAGTRVFEAEQERGRELMQSLSPAQRSKALLGVDLPDEVFTAAYRDNFELRYEGLRFDDLTASQSILANRLIETYLRRMRAGHDEAWLADVRAHLDETYFAWMGSADADNVFYYRVHSPVILIEFDHLKGIALDSDVASEQHIHTVVRTPNGNDYGRDLLRQHREMAHRT